MSTVKAVPHVTMDSEAFWAACNEERLTVQKCNACGALQFYPRSICSSCASDDLEMIEVSGQGEVYTFTINHRAPSEAFGANGPYVIALIDLDEGPRMMMNVIGCAPDAVDIGMRVKVIFEQRGDMKLPQATPA